MWWSVQVMSHAVDDLGGVYGEFLLRRWRSYVVGLLAPVALPPPPAPPQGTPVRGRSHGAHGEAGAHCSTCPTACTTAWDATARATAGAVANVGSATGVKAAVYRPEGAVETPLNVDGRDAEWPWTGHDELNALAEVRRAMSIHILLHCTRSLMRPRGEQPQDQANPHPAPPSPPSLTRQVP